MTVSLHPERSDLAKVGSSKKQADQNTRIAAEEHLVIFTLGNEKYAVDIGDVWEINTMQKITHIPRTPHFIEGVINLRGEIIPVMDLRKRLKLVARAYDRDSRIMVAQSSHNRLGLIVDSVQEVLKIPGDVIMPASELGGLIDEKFVRGIARKEEQLVVLFDLQRLLDEDEHAAIDMMEMA